MAMMTGVALAATLTIITSAPPPFPLEDLLKNPEAARTFDYWRLRQDRTPAEVLALGDTVTKASRDGACQTDAEREVVAGLASAADASSGSRWRAERDAGANVVLAYYDAKTRLLSGRSSGDPALDEAMAEMIKDWRSASTPRARALLRRHVLDQLPMQMALVASNDPKLPSGAMMRLFGIVEQEECRNSHVLSAWLKADVARHGWPRPSRDGKAAAEAAWLIAQHADHDVAFQKYALSQLTSLLPSGDLDRSHYALLWDRVATHEGRPQRYGTQTKACIAGKVEFWPIEDPDHVDARRASLGMGTLAAYGAALAEFEHCHA